MQAAPMQAVQAAPMQAAHLHVLSDTFGPVVVRILMVRLASRDAMEMISGPPQHTGLRVGSDLWEKAPESATDAVLDRGRKRGRLAS